MLRCNILSIFLAFSLLAGAQDWKVVRENPQKAFPKTVAAGNYSGIAHLHDDIYAVVSDKSDSALYFNFRIQVNPKTGELEQVENLGFTERTDGTLNDGKFWQGQEKGFDHEAIADSTQRHEEKVHRKAGPYQQTRFLIAPYFAYQIIDDVAYREYDESTGKGNWPEGDLLCFEYVCCNQANAEEDAEKHKQHAHLSFFLVHFLVFYEVYQALGLLNMMILFRNRLQNYNISS